MYRERIRYAKDEKCSVCGGQAVTYYPLIDPDIPAFPYCPKCLEQAMIDMANAVWKDNKEMRLYSVFRAKEFRKRLESEQSNQNK